MAVFIYRWKRIFTVLFIIVSFFVLFQINLKTKGRKNNHKSSININVLHSDRNGGKLGRNNDRKLDLLKNQKCTIPRLDINGSEVIHFFHTPKPLACQISGNVEEDWVFLDDEGVIRFSGNRQKAKCQMQYFWRSSDDDNNYGEMIDIKDGDRFNGSDFGSVTCYQGFTKWTTLLWTITDNEEAHKRARKLTKLEKRKSYNVYFLGFDSLSQMSFRRKLPRTVKFLEETLGSVVLNGYNIVGDGTPQAFIPILTGQTETELPLSRKRFPESKYLDEIYPMAWKNYSDKGYVTMFGEDMHQVATFTYRLKGFHHQPTDHYPRTFFKDVEYRGDSTCINSQPVHKIWFQNCEKFMKVYKDVPRFLLMHQGLLSHDDINLVGVEDIDLSDHLNHMNNEGIFDDSFVIVMADHGHRFAKLRETHQGQLEERMPFFSISIPKELRSTEEGQLMEKNLRENAEKLTSPFDIHASLMDILNLSSHESGFYEMQDASSERSLSVFRPIPTNRTCAQAGIEPHWCTCLSWKSAMDTSEDRLLTKRIATAVVDQFNKEISAEKDLCAPLSLSTILDAKKLIPDKDLLAYTNVKDPDGFVPDLSGNTKTAFAHYQLKIQTTPGNAIYEVTLFYDMINEELKMDFGAISHVNKSQKLKKSSSLALFYAKFAVDIVFGFADLVTVFLMLSKLLSTSPGILDYYPNLYFYAVWSALTISNLRTFFVLTINFDRVFAVFFPLFYFKFRVKIANSVLILIPFLHIIVDNSVLWGFCEFELNIPSGCITSICLGMSCYIKYLLALEVVAHSLIVSTSLLLAGKLFIWNNCKTGVKSKELERANQLALIDALIIFVFGVVPAVVMTIFPSLFERLGSILIVAKMSGNALESYLVYRALKREKVTTSTVKARSFLAAGATSTKQISD